MTFHSGALQRKLVSVCKPKQLFTDNSDDANVSILRYYHDVRVPSLFIIILGLLRLFAIAIRSYGVIIARRCRCRCGCWHCHSRYLVIRWLPTALTLRPGTRFVSDVISGVILRRRCWRIICRCLLLLLLTATWAGPSRFLSFLLRFVPDSWCFFAAVSLVFLAITRDFLGRRRRITFCSRTRLLLFITIAGTATGATWRPRPSLPEIRFRRRLGLRRSSVGIHLWQCRQLYTVNKVCLTGADL